MAALIKMASIRVKLGGGNLSCEGFAVLEKLNVTDKASILAPRYAISSVSLPQGQNFVANGQLSIILIIG